MGASQSPHRIEAALFISCLTDIFFPEVGEDTVWLLEQAGVRVTFPAGQTCCGQPAFNAGFHDDARPAARHFLRVFADAPLIVTPSGSCAAMVRNEYRHLFEDEPKWRAAAEAVAGRTFELAQFLVGVAGKTDFGTAWPGRATYHDACHGSRGLGSAAEPRALLANVRGLELVEMEEPNWCCGFGGAFATKQAAISGAMLNEKIRRIEAVAVETVISGDAGCILHLAGGLQRQGKPARMVHLAQVLRGRMKGEG